MRKRIFSYLILLSLCFCLTACTFTRSGVLAGDATSTPKVEEMMGALAEQKISEAKTLMHSQVAEMSGEIIEELIVYLNGRRVSSLKQTNISKMKLLSSSNNEQKEQITYQVTLSDDTVIYLNSTYLSSDTESGFTVFYFIVGVV